MEIRPLQKSDDRSRFHSEDPDLDRFFSKYAGQNQFRHHLGTTWVALEAGRIIGFATIAAGQLECEDLPEQLRRKAARYPLPVLRLARLAVDVSVRSQGIGNSLLRHVFLLAIKMAEEYGCVGVVADAKPAAVEFYTRIGFTVLEAVEGQSESRPAPRPMFLPLHLVAAALAPRGR